MLLSVAAISAWYCMPIYPDEIAFRLQLGRYIQDKGVVQGLYAICASNLKETPLLFVIPAWLLSTVDLALSSVQMRVIPFCATLLAIFLAIWFAVRGRTPKAAVMATTALIGVAGSGLILARYEYAQVLNIVCCMATIHYLESGSLRPTLRNALVVLLFASCLLTLYAHLQGLLFLPLSLYLMFLLINTKLGKITSLLLILLLFVLMTRTAITFNHSSCDGYPEIEQFWSKMTLQTSSFKSLNIQSWLIMKISNYLQSFLYKGNYTVNYLPGITLNSGWPQFSLLIFNRAIQGVVLINLLLSVFTTACLSAVTLKRLIRQRKIISYVSNNSIHMQIFSLILLLAPVVFLFFYDAAQNFYRSFFINLLVSIILTMVVSRIPLGRYRGLANMYFVVCGITVLASFGANLWWFTGRLNAGFEGPSISIKSDWDKINKDVTKLAQDCEIDLSKGRIVIDDLTYDSLKRYPLLYPVTYLNLTSDLTKLTSADVISRVRPNYAIARCDNLRAWGVSVHKSQDQLCCANFLNASQGDLQ